VLDAGQLTIGLGPLAAAFAVAAVVGAGALWLVLRLLEQARFKIFSVYVAGLAMVVLLVGIPGA
jgi:undecaprenyl-diphosphatase